MVGFRCVLILSLMLSSTIVNGHSIYRRDSHSNDEGEGEKTDVFKSFSYMLKVSAQKIKDSLKSGYHYVRGRIGDAETNCTSQNITARDSSVDEDTIVFNNDDGTDVTVIMTTDDSDEKEDPTTLPTILNRSLLDTPIACGGGQQLGKDGKCRVVW